MRKSTSLDTITKPALVIDLDDTIVRVTEIRPHDMNENNFFTIKLKKRKFYVEKRPNLTFFLDKISNFYDIYFFTASHHEYANSIIDKILPEIDESCRFFRDSCIDAFGYCVKDLSLIRRPLKKVLLVDDFAGSALLFPKNLVRVKPWNGEKDDIILLDLANILEGIALERDLRSAFHEILEKSKVKGINAF